MAVRNYINGAQLLTLTVGVNTTAVTLEVTSTAGFPTAPFTLALERGTVNEEVVLCSAKTATTFTVTRGWDGTTGKAHSIGAALEHTTAAIDYNEANAHINNSSGDVHSQYVLKSEFGAKGRILVGTGAGTFDDLPVGPNGKMLIADSAQATGLAWADVPVLAITNGSISAAQLTTAAEQSLIARQGSAPAAVNGRVYFNTGDNQWYGYNGSWRKLPWNAGKITISSASPSGGADGDIWFKF